MPHCPNCNAELPEDSLFCPTCGLALTSTREDTPSTATESAVRERKCRNRWPFIIPLIIIFAIAIGFVVYNLTLPFSEDTAAMANAAQSVVKLCCYDHNGEQLATGSGFFVYDDMTIFTNYHVMENAYSCDVLTESDTVFSVESILAYSKSLDIAILKISSPSGLLPLSLGTSEQAEKGSPVIAIGSPLGIQNTVSQGVLSGRIKEDAADILQFTAPISSGSSGGALFDDTGKVIGITFASYTDGQNLNLAIPIEQAMDLYTKRGEASDVSSIYLAAHPYVPYLEEYEHIAEVSIQDLKRNPDRYDGKLVKVRAFVSSVFQGTLCYISERSYVSGSRYADIKTISGTDFENHAYIYAVGASDCKYEEQMLSPGDPVVIIGEFQYKTIGEAYFVLGDTPYYTGNTDATLLGDLIYKEA